MKKKEIIKNAFYLLNEVSDLKYQLELEKLENKKLRKQLSLYSVVVAERTLCDCQGSCEILTPRGEKTLICKGLPEE